MDLVLASARADIRFSMEVFLREQPGVLVSGTATGSEGLLALIESTCPALVILDWNLPGRPAADLLAEVQSAARRPYIIVLGKDGATRKAALRAGADAFALRGDPPQYLLEAIQQARLQTKTAVEGQTLSSIRRTPADNPTSTETKGDQV